MIPGFADKGAIRRHNEILCHRADGCPEDPVIDRNNNAEITTHISRIVPVCLKFDLITFAVFSRYLLTLRIADKFAQLGIRLLAKLVNESV